MATGKRLTGPEKVRHTHGQGRAKSIQVFGSLLHCAFSLDALPSSDVETRAHFPSHWLMTKG